MDEREVLLVEDDFDSCEFILIWLDFVSFSVSFYHSFAEGLRAACEGHFAALLLNVRLTDGSGLHLWESIRECDTATPKLIISAAAYSSVIEPGFCAGGQAYFTKLLDLDVLKITLVELTKSPEAHSLSGVSQVCNLGGF